MGDKDNRGNYGIIEGNRDIRESNRVLEGYQEYTKRCKRLLEESKSDKGDQGKFGGIDGVRDMRAILRVFG